MTTKIKIEHKGGNEAVEVVRDTGAGLPESTEVVATLESIGETYENYVTSSQSFIVREKA